MDTQKDRLEKLMQINGIKSQTDLLRKIFDDGHRNRDEIERQIKLAKANFSKAVSGERPFTQKYIVKIEKILNTSIKYIVEGGEENEKYVSRGLRYAASTNSYPKFKELGDCFLDDTSNRVIENTDEYDNSILDYIFSYEAIEGLKYLYDEKIILPSILHHIDFAQGTAVNPVTDQFNKILELVCKKDDSKFFNKLFLSPEYLDASSKHYLYSKSNLESVLNTRNVLEGLLVGLDYDLHIVNIGLQTKLEKGHFCSPFLYHLVSYALRTDNVKYKDQILKIIKFGIKYNEKVIKHIKALSNEEKIGLKISEKGYVMSGHTIYGSIFTYKLEDTLDIDNEINKQLDIINNQNNRITFTDKKLLGGFSKSSVRIQDGYILKNSTGNKIEYEFLNYMKDCQYSKVPRLHSQDNGVDKLTYFKGNIVSMYAKIPISKTKMVIQALRDINNLSKKKLNSDKVYVHGDLAPVNTIFSDKDELVGIIDWDKTYIGEEYEDLIYVLWTWLNIGDIPRDYDKLYKDFKKLVIDCYKPSDSLRRNFADKMIKVMDKKLSLTSKNSEQYLRIFNWVGWSKIWVEYCRERITKDIG